MIAQYSIKHGAFYGWYLVHVHRLLTQACPGSEHRSKTRWGSLQCDASEAEVVAREIDKGRFPLALMIQ